MTKSKQPDLSEVDRALDRALGEVLRSSPDVATLTKVRRRRWFGIGILVLSVFCAVVAAIPFPNKQLIDIVTWVGYALVLLCIGGWSIDRASKEELKTHQKIEELDGQVQDPDRRKGMHRVK